MSKKQLRSSGKRCRRGFANGAGELFSGANGAGELFSGANGAGELFQARMARVNCFRREWRG